MDIIFWDFLILYQIFFSPQVKWSVIISNKHSIYDLSHELSNELRLFDLKTWKLEFVPYTPLKTLNPKAHEPRHIAPSAVCGSIEKAPKTFLSWLCQYPPLSINTQSYPSNSPSIRQKVWGYPTLFNHPRKKTPS